MEVPTMEIARRFAPVPRLLSLTDAARSLGVSDRFLRMLEARGQLRLTRLGRRVLVSIEEVERLAKEGAR
jgi:excisionase family DNA binding protein